MNDSSMEPVLWAVMRTGTVLDTFEEEQAARNYANCHDATVHALYTSPQPAAHFPCQREPLGATLSNETRLKDQAAAQVPEGWRAQVRRVRNYSNPDDVFEAVPVRALEAEASAPQSQPAVPEGWEIEKLDHGGIQLSKNGRAGCVCVFNNSPITQERVAWDFLSDLLTATPSIPEKRESSGFHISTLPPDEKPPRDIFAVAEAADRLDEFLGQRAEFPEPPADGGD